MTDILCVIPCYNEEQNLPEVIEGIRSVDVELDIVVVDDASTDSTKHVAEEEDVDTVRHPVNLGAGKAVQTGCKYAVQNDYQIVVTIDGDGQHPPEKIPDLIDRLRSTDADLCIGSRFKGEIGYEMSFLRSIGNKLFSFMVSSASEEPITDVTSGFRTFHKTIAMNYASKTSFPEDIWAVEVTYFTIREGYKVGETAVEMQSRENGRSHLNSIKICKYPVTALYGVLANT